MSFKCDKCGAEFEKEFAMKMHNKVCGTKPAERPKPQTAGNASAFKPAAANSVPASLPANVPAGISAGQMAGASSFTVPGPNKRICAYLIDSTIIVTFTNIINLGAIINFILQTAFILCRDANNAQGPGKKFVGLIVETDAGSSAEPQKCILRNVTLALPSLLLLLAPFIGGSIAALLCVAPVIVEYIMTRKNSEGRRIGDMIAGTRVNDIAPEKSDSQFFWYGLLAIILCVVLSTYLGSGMKQHDFVGNSGNGGSYQAAAMKWESYNSTAGGYSIMMPGKPEEKKEEIPAGNVKIMTNAAIIKTGAAEFVSMAMDFPGAISENNIDKILDSAKGNLIADPNDKIDSERKITLGVHQGREYKMSLGRGHNFKMQGKIFINVKGRKLIILSVQYNGDAFDEANAATFMNSLKIY